MLKGKSVIGQGYDPLDHLDFFHIRSDAGNPYKDLWRNVLGLAIKDYFLKGLHKKEKARLYMFFWNDESRDTVGSLRWIADVLSEKEDGDLLVEKIKDFLRKGGNRDASPFRYNKEIVSK